MEATKEETLAFLKIALEFELDVMQTYADQAEDVEGEQRDLLLKISEDEKMHANMVKKLIEKVEGMDWK